MADNVGAPVAVFATTTGNKPHVVNKAAFPNELPFRANLFRKTRRMLQLYFRPHPSGDDNPRARRSQYTYQELGQHKKEDFEASLPGLEIVNHDLKYLSKDGTPLVVFLKGGLNILFEYTQEELADNPNLAPADLPARGMKAFKELTTVYPPLPPKDSGVRHTANAETEGVGTGYYHLALWQTKGHDHKEKDNIRLTPARCAVLSKDCFPNANGIKTISNAACITTFYQRLAPITQAVGALFELVDIINYKSYRKRYLELFKHTPLSQFNFSQYRCFVGNACLVGLQRLLHRDARDSDDGWVADLAFGDFDGGYLQLPQLGCQKKLQPGDLLFMRSKCLIHGVSSVPKGLRYSMVYFSHEGMLAPTVKDQFAVDE